MNLTKTQTEHFCESQSAQEAAGTVTDQRAKPGLEVEARQENPPNQYPVHPQ